MSRRVYSRRVFGSLAMALLALVGVVNMDEPAEANLPNCSNCIEAGDIATGGVRASEIASGAVGASEIATDAVRAAEIFAGAVRSSEIANGSIGVADLGFDPATQAELDAASYCGRAASAPDTYPTGACGSVTNRVATSAGSFTLPSITLGVDGLPAISFYDGTAKDLMFAHCADAACARVDTVERLDETGDVGITSSIAIGADGLPVIGYTDTTNGNLRVAHCGDVLCSSVGVAVVDVANVVGRTPSIAIVDGYPVISHYDSTNFDLRVARCGSIDCTTGNVLSIVDSAGSVGSSSSIAIGIDGLPVISYHAHTTGLKVAHCENVACSANTTIASGFAPSVALQLTDIAIGVDGNPIVTFWNSDVQDVGVMHCQSISCATGTTTVIDDGVVGYPSIAIRGDGLPMIAYIDATDGEMEIARCGSVTCSTGNVVSTGSSVGGFYSSTAIGADGVPIVTHLDSSGELFATRISTS